MADRIVISLRDAAKGKKRDEDVEHIYTGSWDTKTLKADGAQDASEIQVYRDGKGAIVGVKYGGYALPYSEVKADTGALDALKTIYRRGRQVIIRGMSVSVPKN